MISIETIHWHTLAPQFLNSASRVLDLGAHYGMFAHAITQRTGCYCVAVEPSPIPFRGIPSSSHIKTIHAAVGDRSGMIGFRVDSQNELASAFTDDPNADIQVKIVTLPELLDDLGWPVVDLIKVDIEGAEIGMLQACPDQLLSKQVFQISIEFHDFCGITPVSIVTKTIQRLRSLGFEMVRMSRIGHQDTWFINRNLLPITKSDMLFHKIVTRNWFGAKRVAARLFYGA